MTFTGIISIKAWPWQPLTGRKFPLVYRPGWRLRSGYMTLVRLLSCNGAIWLFGDHRWSDYCRINYGDKCRGYRRLGFS